MDDMLERFPITVDLLPRGTRRRPGSPLPDGVKFLVAHDTGNPGSTARANVRYYKNSANEKPASAHFFVDDREVIECVPAFKQSPPERALHVRDSVPIDNQLFGVNANDAALGVEYCYGGAINADEAYRRYVWLLAVLCWHYQLDPKRHIVGHYFLDPSRRSDPVTGLAHSRRSIEGLLHDVAQELAMEARPATLPPALEDSGSKTVKARLNVRYGKPSTSAPVVKVLSPGTKVTLMAQVEGQPVSGNSTWYKIGDNEFIWSGATT